MPFRHYRRRASRFVALKDVLIHQAALSVLIRQLALCIGDLFSENVIEASNTTILIDRHFSAAIVEFGDLRRIVVGGSGSQL